MLFITHSFHMASTVLISTHSTQTVHVVLALEALAVCGLEGQAGG